MTDKKFNIEVMYQGKAQPGHIFAASYWDAIFKLTYYCGFQREDIIKCKEAEPLATGGAA
tara:strand:+ start:160 stop:339 length:180 start_codon:yes stop_codon:yes gene_type:complete